VTSPAHVAQAVYQLAAEPGGDGAAGQRDQLQREGDVARTGIVVPVATTIITAMDTPVLDLGFHFSPSISSMTMMVVAITGVSSTVTGNIRTTKLCCGRST